MDHSQPTKKQWRVLTLLAKGIKKGVQPSIRDLMKSLRISSPNGVVCHLKALERKGYIKRPKNRSRSILINWKKYSGPEMTPIEREQAIAYASRKFLAALEGRA